MKNKKDIKFIALMIVTAILLVAVIVMGVLLHRMYNNISLLGNRITYISDSAEILLSDMDNLQSNIEATLEEETSLLESWNIDLVETDFKKKKYTLDVVIIPKEFTDTTEVSVYFGTNKFELPKNDFSYEALISLPMGESYEKKVTVLLVDGKKKSTEIIRGYKDVQHDFNNILSGNLTNMPKYEEGQLSFDGAFDFVLKGKSEFEFKEFQMHMMAGKEEIDNVDLKEKYQLKETKDEEEILAEPISELTGTYQMNKSFEVEEGTDIRIFLRAVSVDGFTFEYDLFNGKISVVEESTETEEDAQEENDTQGFDESENYFAGNYSVYDQKGAKYEKN